VAETQTQAVWLATPVNHTGQYSQQDTHSNLLAALHNLNSKKGIQVFLYHSSQK